MGTRSPPKLRSKLPPKNPLDCLPPSYIARREQCRPVANIPARTTPSTTSKITITPPTITPAPIIPSHPVPLSTIRQYLYTSPFPNPPVSRGRARQRRATHTISRAPRDNPFPLYQDLPEDVTRPVFVRPEEFFTPSTAYAPRPTIARSSPPRRQDGSIDVWEVQRARHRPSTPPLWQF